jgi:hypothetical protein
MASLQEYGESATPELVRALRHPNKAVRSGAAEVLGAIRPVSEIVFPRLVEALDDESPEVSRSVAEALEDLGPSASPAIPLLIEALQHSSEMVRVGACRGLGSIGRDASPAIPALVEALRDSATRWPALHALGRIIPNFADSLREDGGTLSEILEVDEFLDHACVKCGTHGALFATPRMFSACPKCLAARIRELRESGAGLPAWAYYLEGAANDEALRQARAEDESFSMSFDDFYHCARCDKLILCKEARYYFPPGANSSSPHCVECYQQLTRRE